MTLLQPNERAAGLRIALDFATERRDRAIALAKIGGRANYEGQLYALNGMIDLLSDQLLDAGGFLGDEPEPEDEPLSAFIIDRNGEIMARRLLGENDSLEPDDYAQHFAQMGGFDLDQNGFIPDGCEDFSVKIAESADAVCCWDSRNYAIKGE